jgi:hypothetical protein
MPEGREEEVQSRRGWQGMGNSYAWQNFAITLGYDEEILNFFVSPLLGNPRLINNRREKTCVYLKG